jgi:hypothetical protein
MLAPTAEPVPAPQQCRGAESQGKHRSDARNGQHSSGDAGGHASRASNYAPGNCAELLADSLSLALRAGQVHDGFFRNVILQQFLDGFFGATTGRKYCDGSFRKNLRSSADWR